MRSEGYCTWSVSLSVCSSVCYHVFCHYAEQGGQKAIPTGSVPHWLDFKMVIFVKVLRSKVMAWKPSKQANMLMSMAYLDQILRDTNGFSATLARLEMAIFVKVLRSKVMAWKPSEQANMLMSIRIVCTPTNLRMRMCDHVVFGHAYIDGHNDVLYNDVRTTISTLLCWCKFHFTIT